MAFLGVPGTEVTLILTSNRQILVGDANYQLYLHS